VYHRLRSHLQETRKGLLQAALLPLALLPRPHRGCAAHLALLQLLVLLLEVVWCSSWLAC
jgi:hypothetical protein